MPIVPSGSAPWLRTAEHTDYGGHVDKVNYQLQGLINPLTDVGAEAFVRLTEDLAAVVRTAPFAVITYTCNDTSPAAPTILSANQMNGVRSTTYEGDAAPSGFPSVARNGDGDVTFTFASSYTDAYGVAGAVNITAATGDAQGGLARCAPVEISGLTVRVRAFDSSGLALTDPTVTLQIWTGPTI